MPFFGPSGARYDRDISEVSIMSNWDPLVKPPAGVCPQDFCFFWCHRSDGSGYCSHTGRWLLPSGESKPDLCIRLDPIHGTDDYYEPHEPNLEEHGLPWFYFYPDAHMIVDDLKEAYRRESEELWGTPNLGD